jgi:hypothetical protein
MALYLQSYKYNQNHKTYFLRPIYIVLPSTPRSSEWFLPLRPSKKSSAYILISPLHATRPTHLVPLDMIILIICGKEYKLQSSSVCSFIYPIVTSFLSGSNIFLSTSTLNSFHARVPTNYPSQYKDLPVECLLAGWWWLGLDIHGGVEVQLHLC